MRFAFAVLALGATMQVHAAGTLAKDRAETRADGRIEVTSADFKAGARIPLRLSGYGTSRSPQLSWSNEPRAKTYAIILEDPDAATEKPYVHWVAWNIPATTTRLPGALKPDADLPELKGMVQGRNDRKDSTGYFGPRPPEGHPPHHYHFQVFALDAALDLPPDAKRDQLVAAMKGHVIAKGELVGVYQHVE